MKVATIPALKMTDLLLAGLPRCHIFCQFVFAVVYHEKYIACVVDKKSNKQTSYGCKTFMLRQLLETIFQPTRLFVSRCITKSRTLKMNTEIFKKFKAASFSRKTAFKDKN